MPAGESQPLFNGGSYKITGGDLDGQVGNISFEEFEEVNFTVLCFAGGTRIQTPSGAVPVEDLSQGDLVNTLDHGPQAIRWIGGRNLSAETLEAHPNLRPIRIARGALGGGLPERDLVVSPQHRVLLRSKVAQRMFGCAEVLIAAKKLVGIDGIEVVTDGDGVEYYHFLCDQHELVWSEGAVTETLHTGEEALKTLTPEARKEIFALFPELSLAAPVAQLARKCPRGRQMKKLVGRIEKNGHALVAAA